MVYQDVIIFRSIACTGKTSDQTDWTVREGLLNHEHVIIFCPGSLPPQSTSVRATDSGFIYPGGEG